MTNFQITEVSEPSFSTNELDGCELCGHCNLIRQLMRLKQTGKLDAAVHDSAPIEAIWGNNGCRGAT